MPSAHVITKDNKHLYQNELIDYHRQRYQVFAKRHNRQDLRNPSALDIDAYDNREAVHILALKHKQVIGGLRLNHSIDSTLISDEFNQLLCLNFDYARQEMMDCTRLFVSPKCEDRTKWSMEAATLYCAIMEYALISRIQGISFVCNIELVNLFATLGWYSKPLGNPQMIDAKLMVAAQVSVNTEALKNIRKKTGISKSVLTSRSGTITKINGRHQVFVEEIQKATFAINQTDPVFH